MLDIDTCSDYFHYNDNRRTHTIILMQSPIKHDTLTQCWHNVCPSSTTLTQQKAKINLVQDLVFVGYRSVMICNHCAVLMLDQRLRRWPTLNQHLVSVPLLHSRDHIVPRILTVDYTFKPNTRNFLQSECNSLSVTH